MKKLLLILGLLTISICQAVPKMEAVRRISQEISPDGRFHITTYSDGVREIRGYNEFTGEYDVDLGVDTSRAMTEKKIIAESHQREEALKRAEEERKIRALTPPNVYGTPKEAAQEAIPTSRRDPLAGTDLGAESRYSQPVRR